MSGYERGIAAERERLLNEFEQRHQTTPLDVSKEHLEPDEVEKVDRRSADILPR